MNAGTGSPFVDINTGDQLGRVEIAVAPSNANYIYAQAQSIVTNSNGGCGGAQGCQIGAWASTNGGTSWTFMEGSQGGALRDCQNTPGDYPQNWYDEGIVVDPNDPERVFFDTFRRLVCNAHGNVLERYDVRLFLQRRCRPCARGPARSRLPAWLVQHLGNWE